MIAIAMFVAGHAMAAWVSVLLALLVGVAVATKGPIGGSAVRSYTAGADALGKGFAVVRGVDDNTVVIAGANVSILGFVDESNISAGQPVGVVEGGECHAPIGAAVAQGAFLVTDASGRVVPTAAAGDNVVAQALTSGANVGDFILIKVLQFTRGSGVPVTYPAVAGAIPVAPGIVGINGAGALAMTLAAPTTPAQDGVTLRIVALTAHAHTVTTPANKIQDANATDDTVTFAHVGDEVVLFSLNGVWQVEALRGATLSEV